MSPLRRPTLLVLRHHGLGDLLTARPALLALRAHFATHELVTTCPSWLVPLAVHLDMADRLVSEIDPTDPRADGAGDPTDHQSVDDRLIGHVMQTTRPVDALVSLRTPGPELVRAVAALAPRLLASYRCEGLPATARFPALDFTDHILVRWRRLLAGIGVAIDDARLHAEIAVPPHEAGATVVHVGAGSPSRVWPAPRWIDVVAHLHRTGHRVVLTGSRSEAGLVAQVASGAGLPMASDRSGSNDILELARLVAGARLVIAGDTGVSHLATTFRRPAVTLFGPVPPAWWGPPPGTPRHRTIWTGRYGENYAAVPDSGLLEISVAQVLRTIEDVGALPA